MCGSFAKYAGPPVLSWPCQVELNRCDPQNETREVKRGRTTHHNRGEGSMAASTSLPTAETEQTQETTNTTEHDAVATQEQPTCTTKSGQSGRRCLVALDLHIILTPFCQGWRRGGEKYLEFCNIVTSNLKYS
jgi:hypothetical protein